MSLACPGLSLCLSVSYEQGTEGLLLRPRLVLRASHPLSPLRQGMLLTQATDGKTED